MKWLLIVAGAIIIGSVIVGCSVRQSQITKKQLEEGRKDIIDRDFVATISKTEKPIVFTVSVKRVNRNVDKKIGSFALVVDFVLRDRRGKVFAAKPGNWPKYAEGIGPAFEKMRPFPVDSFSGTVKLIPKDLSPGKYQVEPYVRINEIGKDALRGPYTDGGSVAVPAGNKITLEIK